MVACKKVQYTAIYTSLQLHQLSFWMTSLKLLEIKIQKASLNHLDINFCRRNIESPMFDMRRTVFEAHEQNIKGGEKK